MVPRPEVWTLRYPSGAVVAVCLLLLPLLLVLRVEYVAIAAISFGAVGVSLSRRGALVLLVVLLPLVHAGLGITSLGGFGVFDIYLLWFLIVCVLRWSLRGASREFGSSGFALGLVMMISFVPSLLNAPELGVSAKGFAQLLASLLLYAAVYDLLVLESDRRLIKRLVLVFVVVSAAVAAYGILETVRGSITAILSGRAYFSLFQDVNYYASYLIMGLALSVGFAMSSERLWVRIVGAGSGLIQMIAIVASVSRSALAVVVLLALAFAFYMLTTQGFGKKIAALAFLAAFVGIIGVVLSTGAAEKLVDLFTLSQRVESVVQGRDASFAQRVTILKVVSRMVADEPLIGVGFNNLEEVFNSYQGGDLSTGSGRSAHNTPFRILAETGIVGFLGSFVFIGFVMIRLMRGTRRARSDPDNAVMFSISASVMGFLAASLTLDQLFEPHFWIVAAFGMALVRLLESPASIVETREG